MTELQTVAAVVMGAQSYLDVFGQFSGSEEETKTHIKVHYRKLTRVLHPDRYHKADDVQLAEHAFSRLGDLRTDADKAAERGQYGQAVVLVTARTRKAVHEIIRSHASGDLCVTFRAETTKGNKQDSFCKVAKRAADRDLLQTEAVALKRLRGPDADPQYYPFIPELLDSFAYAEKGKPTRQANVIGLLEGFYNLDELAVAFPGGLSPLHVVWVWRRLLVTLGHAHDNHVVHGAVLPRHVMVLPEQHGVMLVDWCYASIAQDDIYGPIRAIVDEHKEWYPEEVFARCSPSPATDIVMAARCMIYLMGGDPLTGNLPVQVPRPLRAFFRGCLQVKQSQRPNNAWLLLEEFDELLEEMGSPYYPRRFRPLTVPSGTV